MAQIRPSLIQRRAHNGPQVLSSIISPFSSPVYNLPIFLFGALVHESNDAVQLLKLVGCLFPLPQPEFKLSYQQFSGVLSASILFDIIWVFNNEQGGFVRLLFFLLWLLKVRVTHLQMRSISCTC